MSAQSLSETVTNALADYRTSILPKVGDQDPGLTALAPAEVHKQAALSLQQAGLEVRFQATGHTYQGDVFRPGPVKVALVVAGSPSWDQALAIAAHLMAPASPEDITDWLNRMALATVPRNANETEMQARVTLFASELRSWPGDVVRDVLTGWHRQSEWFPNAWKTIQDQLEAAMGERRKIVAAIESAARRAQRPEPPQLELTSACDVCRHLGARQVVKHGDTTVEVRTCGRRGFQEFGRPTANVQHPCNGFDRRRTS